MEKIGAKRKFVTRPTASDQIQMKEKKLLTK